MKRNRNRNICIIDDDPIFVFGTKRMMSQINFCNEIYVFKNGQEAIIALTEMLEEEILLPSVIFLDLNMPIMNGWEFLDDFIKIPKYKRGHVTVFIVSSSIDPRDMERVKTYKAVNKFLVKPITPKDLQIAIQEVA